MFNKLHTHLANPATRPLTDAMPIPAKWREKFAGDLIERQAIGESRADVFRIRCINREELFLKSEPVGSLSELPDEIERLRWLEQRNLPGPTVLDAITEHNRHWLLMSAVPGHDLAGADDLSIIQVIGIMARALRTLHQVPIAECPFDHRLEKRLAAVKNRIDAGLVDDADFDDERQGQTTEDVYAELLSTLPKTHDLVVTHGDACLQNFMADSQQFTGFIDCGRLGISDRYQDLALAARSITHHFGMEWVEPFFREYGIEPDMQRMRFYCFLDEFF
ncbi:APH(3')-II family aminoglycoside O-phosphotransferase [Janthinobacterium fluminis]|uniref:Aminoglycoside 3'-phosphotransferase n=1 Tax=Janthinobacterium fluminis TaxID=2987524 RepID=A0ABT5JYP3_9BURK|nr:APH(3') family aminoglycoside O-phosphotransferase [Janthinobacterium fluminis]MDC8757853.1 aminoglycoside 3'-phosphotransferase [Janthinobacterium fluminis]